MQKFKLFSNLTLIYSEYADKNVTNQQNFLTAIKQKYNIQALKQLYFFHPHQAGRLLDFQNQPLVNKEVEVDAVVSDRPDTFLYMNVADCFPVVLFEPTQKVFALIHAGWKPLAQNILELTVLDMISQYGCSAQQLKAWIGPGIQKCCYQFPNQPSQLVFNEKYQGIVNKIKKNDQTLWQVDLKEFINLELKSLGIAKENIQNLNHCTCCQLDDNQQPQYWSHRRFSLGKEKRDSRIFVGIVKIPTK